MLFLLIYSAHNLEVSKHTLALLGTPFLLVQVSYVEAYCVQI
jgi:hypothetical protein